MGRNRKYEVTRTERVTVEAASEEYAEAIALAVLEFGPGGNVTIDIEVEELEAAALTKGD